jgi:hypothetical protein
VVVFADNDFGDLIRNRIYRLDADGNLELNRYSLAPEMRARMLEAAHPHGLHQLQLYRYAAKVWQLRQARRQGPPRTWEEGLLAAYIDYSLKRSQVDFQDYMADHAPIRVAADPFRDPYDADIALRPDLPSSRYKNALMEGVLVKLRDVAAKHAAGLILLILPSAIDVCDHYDIRVEPREYPQYDRARLSTLVEEMAARHGILHLNLWHTFQSDPACHYFRGGDGHWDEAGQAQAAQLLSALITHNGLLTDSPE